MGLEKSYNAFYQSEKYRSVFEWKEEMETFSKGLFAFVVDAKTRFLKDADWNSLKILETGSGRGGVGLHLARLGAKVTLLDFSLEALHQGQAVFESEGLAVQLIHGDVTHPDLEIPEKFDLIIDSHLLHCLTEDPDRSSYYRLVSDHLRPGGIFVVETMVHRKKLFVPEGFMFDERFVLWQLLGEWKAVRRILDSLDLEEELKNAQFQIIYFYYYGQYSFVPHKSFLDIPDDILPAAVRFVTQNKS